MARCVGACRTALNPELMRGWALAALGYLALALLLCGAVSLRPAELALGYPTPDAMDTAVLRSVVAGGLENGTSKVLFAPVGYPFAALLPNRVDHLLAAPLVWLFPWPLADNLWWMLALAANGLAAHALGRQVGGSHGAGALCGVAFACAEPVLREANLGHAPQALAFAMPLVVLGLARTGFALLGFAMALAGLIYWVQPLFLLAICAPFALASPRELPRLLRAAALCCALVALPAAVALGAWDGLAMTDPGALPLLSRPGLEKIPPEARFLFTQGVDPLAWILPGPADRASRLPLALLVAAAWGARAGSRWRWFAAAALGVVMAMGPFLRWREQPVILGGDPIPLPGWFLAQSSEIMGRLHWPQRWAVVVPLALLPLAARVPRPWLITAMILAETAVFSPHFPLWSAPTGQLDGWRGLRGADGPVLVWPAQPTGPQQALTGWIQRASEVELARAMHLPPGTPEPREWEAFLARALADGPDPEALRAAGLSAVALDATPGGVYDEAALSRERARLASLDEAFGPPVDLGSAIVWWIRPPEPPPEPMPDAAAWRAAWRARLAESDRRPVPGGYPVMRWNVPGGRGEGRQGPVMGVER